MKLSHFLLATGLLSFSAAAAQTTPGNTTPSNPGPKGTASASAGVSGMAPPAANPRGAVNSGEMFTKGDPNGYRARPMNKRKTTKTSEGSMKMKTKM